MSLCQSAFSNFEERKRSWGADLSFRNKAQRTETTLHLRAALRFVRSME